MKKSELKQLIRECINETIKSMEAVDMEIPFGEDVIECEVEFDYDAPYRATHTDPGQGWTIYVNRIVRRDNNTEIEFSTLDKSIQSAIEDKCADYMEDRASSYKDDAAEYRANLRHDDV